MGKSADLYTLCDVCHGDGITGSGDPNFFKWSRGFPVCVACDGEKYLPLGLNKAQVDAALRKAGEYDKFMADFANDGGKPLPGDSPVESSGWLANDYTAEIDADGEGDGE